MAQGDGVEIECLHRMLDEWEVPEQQRRDQTGLEGRIGALVNGARRAAGSLRAIAALHERTSSGTCAACGTAHPCDTWEIARGGGAFRTGS